MTKIKSILVVDDNKIDRAIAKYMINKCNYFEHYMELTDGKEAYELFKNHEKSSLEYPETYPPVLILLDANMPVMNGFEFLEKLYNMHFHEIYPIKVIMLTSSDNYEDIDQCKKYPFVKDYINKPLTLKKIEELGKKYSI
jgi:CheY-like chemotaxis protein